MLWNEYCMLQYVPFLQTDLYFILLELCVFQGNYCMYFQRKQWMHVCGVPCSPSVNASQRQEINTETCLGWFSSSS